MASSLEPLAPGGCPDLDTLAAFNVGNLPLKGLESIAEHVSSCAQCESILSDLAGDPDGDMVLAYLKRCLGREKVSKEEDGAARLAAAARDLPRARAETVQDAATPPDGIPLKPKMPESIGRYEVLERIGQGGMGVVYKARQRPVNRLVALKMILAGVHAGSQARARFHVEGQAVARLHHANFVHIYEFGEHEGLPYFSMEYVAGGNLADRLAQGPMPARAAAELMRTLAGALAFAHGRHVLHRDLKPGNILLTSEGDPKITDFGLAKLLDEESEHTRSDVIMGTPQYMAPEQAEARLKDIGPATDVYSLGAILYEALAGRKTFLGATKADILHQVCRVSPEPPSRHRRGIPPVLDAICLKCLEKGPRRRYLSAQGLADDLDHWLKGEPTVARPPRWPERLRRGLWRHKVLVGCVLAALAALMVWLRLDPERPLREIEAELAQGKPVTLIGQTGLPRLARVLQGDRTSLNLGSDGIYSVHTWDQVCLVELASAPRQDRYRLTASIRHEKAEYVGSVGLFFGHHKVPEARGDIHVFAQFHYNDVVSTREWLESIGQGHLRTPEGSLARLSPQIYGQQGGKIFIEGVAHFNASSIFQPGGRLKPKWRDLEVIVEPDKFRLSWDHQPFKEFTLAECQKPLAEWLPKWIQRRPEESHLAQLDTALHPRGSLGLFLSRSSASFREVTVTPNPPTEPKEYRAFSVSEEK